MTLSHRLAAIAGYIEKGAVVADIGTDHAYLPIWLKKNGICDRVTASDIGRKPLEKGMRAAEEAGVANINFVLAPGLAGCRDDRPDTVIIAGMGGETIISILEADPWALDTRLIIQPQSKHRELREWLISKGYAIADGRLVQDMGRIYQIWIIEKGECTALSPMDYYIDPVIRRNGCGLISPYCNGLIKNLENILTGFARSADNVEAEVQFCREALAGLKQLKKENQLCQK